MLMVAQCYWGGMVRRSAFKNCHDLYSSVQFWLVRLGFESDSWPQFCWHALKLILLIISN